MFSLWLFLTRRRYIARCTIRQHYYPESGWGWVVVVTGVMARILATGIHGAAGTWLLLEGTKRYSQPVLNVGTILFSNVNVENCTLGIFVAKLFDKTCTLV